MSFWSPGNSVSNEYLVINCIFFSVYNASFIVGCFQEFFICNFSHATVMFLGVVYFVFILLEVD